MNTTERGQLVAVGMREPFDEPFASAQFVGGLAGGVGLVQQGGCQIGELVIVEAGQQVAESHGGRDDSGSWNPSSDAHAR